ncbi:hypothetical protein PF008_g230 [Phytophthora fragariae]|uniref:Secreted protein n=1 Tax=Phytophthora fragariae TaxID=53985 RepID=A0A6G0SP81_9STRA|nr:hypothetical protein PF008_g230 [Phytophthora fragariae]
MYQCYSNCLSLMFLSLSKRCFCLINVYSLSKSVNRPVEIHITNISACLSTRNAATPLYSFLFGSLKLLLHNINFAHVACASSCC